MQRNRCLVTIRPVLIILLATLLVCQRNSLQAQTTQPGGLPLATATVQQPDQPRLVAQLGHALVIYSVAFSPDGRHVLTGSEDNIARLWDVETGKEVRRFEGHGGGIISVAFSPDGRYVLTGSWDGTARLWDRDTGKEVRKFEGHATTIWSVAFSPDGRYVLTGSRDKTARLWDRDTGKEVKTFKGHAAEIISWPSPRMAVIWRLEVGAPLVM